MYFDFKSISESEDEFWLIFLANFYEKIKENDLLKSLCTELTQTNLKGELLKIFKNGPLVDHIIDCISTDSTRQNMADAHFYGETIKKKEIQNFFYGFMSLALRLDKLIILCFDEIQYLIDVDPNKNLIKVFLDQFIRKLIETFRDKRLYLVISCLQNPKQREYDALKASSMNFKTIADGKEIFLGNLLNDEKKAIIEQVADKLAMSSAERRKFTKKIQSRIDYFVPRGLLKSIGEVLESLGYMAYSKSEVRELYEKEARSFIQPELLARNFEYIEDKPKKVGGFNIDIYATARTNRAKRVAQAFGEVTITRRQNMKAKIEKFSQWLSQMHGKEFRPDLNDFAFFICPSNRITRDSQELLNSNQIELYEFDSTVT